MNNTNNKDIFDTGDIVEHNYKKMYKNCTKGEKRGFGMATVLFFFADMLWFWRIVPLLVGKFISSDLYEPSFCYSSAVYLSSFLTVTVYLAGLAAGSYIYGRKGNDNICYSAVCAVLNKFSLLALLFVSEPLAAVVSVAVIAAAALVFGKLGREAQIETDNMRNDTLE